MNPPPDQRTRRHERDLEREGSRIVVEPGSGIRTWLAPVLVASVLSLIFALYKLDQNSLSYGSIVDANTLQWGSQIPQVDRVRLPAKPATYSETITLRQAIAVSTTLLVISDRAGTVTALVGLYDNRVNRIFASANAASSVLRYAQAAEELMPGSDMADCLRDLAVALSAYDIDRVRSSSSRLAELRQQFTSAINESQQSVSAPGIANMKLE